MDAKLRLAFKKIFEKKISKEKYLDKQTEAAQKALEKVRKMKEARMFNISLYKYKGDIKGIKVVPKNPKTPNVSKDPEIIDEPVKEETAKEEPVKEESLKEEPVKEEDNPEEEKEEILPEHKPELISHDLPDNFIEFLMNEMKKAETVGENVKVVESEEMEEPKPKRRTRKTSKDKIANNVIPQRRKNQVLEELTQSPAIPSRVPKPKPVKPAPIRRGRAPDQKYVYTESKLNTPENIVTDLPTGQQQKIRRDYKNNKGDRLKAIQTITFMNK